MPRKNPNPQARRARAKLKQRMAAKAAKAAKKPKRPMTVLGIPAALFAYLLGGRRDV